MPRPADRNYASTRWAILGGQLLDLFGWLRLDTGELVPRTLQPGDEIIEFQMERGRIPVLRVLQDEEHQ
jgi:hypothetical protein